MSTGQRSRRSSPAFARVQPAIAYVASRTDEDVALAAVARHVGLSPFHLQRMFAAVAGETPKQFALRVRLARGAAMLLAGGDTVLDIALACGFASHEAFTRAFRRRFGMAPREYRDRGFAHEVSGSAAASHARIVNQLAPCVGLYNAQRSGHLTRNLMAYTVVKKELDPQPVLVVRRRVPRSEIAATIGGVLPDIFQYAQQRGMALAGHPFTRYVDVGMGLLTIEPGMRIAAPAASTSPQGEAASGVVEDILPGGPAATTVHAGPYETLGEAYGALEAWMQSEGLQAAGAPWESYITDPAEHPDPKDWRTEICWPVR